MTSRRQFLVRSLQVGALVGAGVPLLQACGSNASGSRKVTKAIADGLSPEKGPLRIFNYADYVNPDVIAAFEKDFGVKVEITTFNSDSEALSKLASGAVKADIHHSMFPSSINRIIDGGLVQPLNKTYLPNFKNVVAKFNDPWYDPKATYSVPYTLYSTGLGYRTDRIDPAEVEAQGWDTLWKASTFKGQVSVLDDPREVFAMAYLHQGLTDINSIDPKVIDAALADLRTMRDAVNAKVNIEAYKDIPEGVTTIAHTWSADLVNAAASFLPQGTDPAVLGFWHPPAGKYVVNNDTIGVTANAEHPVLAHAYINYLLDEANAETNFSWTGYLPALTTMTADYVIGKGLVPENLKQCIPTPEEIAKGLSFAQLGAEGDGLYDAAWSKFTSGA